MEKSIRTAEAENVVSQRKIVELGGKMIVKIGKIELRIYKLHYAPRYAVSISTPFSYLLEVESNFSVWYGRKLIFFIR